MFGGRAGGGTGGRGRLALRLLGIAATGFGIWGLFQLSWSTRITACGFDANGAYAEVRVSSLLGAQEVWVDFSLDGTQYTYAGAYDVRGTTVLRAPFPEKRGPLHVSGRTVYVDPKQHDKLVTRKFAEASRSRILTEVVPDSSHNLTCGFDHTDPD
ncbi:hypothetical protein [Nocardioides cynanchi]|uniref:hypothetical protein n=1 Tax=Nocardioides cynanchi TaxID=2558918 RepID=UPI0012487005|nr:hypothetical protein [Nocardioides cynanchi]